MNVDAVVVKNVEEEFGLINYLRLSLITQTAQFRRVLLEESLLEQFLVKQLAVGLIEFAEDVLAELLYLSYHVPVLVVLQILVNVVHYPRQDLVIFREIVYQVVNGITFYLIVVEFDAQVGSKVEFACQIAQNTLEEGVDSFNTEVAIVVHYIVKCHTRTFSHELLRNVHVSLYLLNVAFRVRQSFPYAIQLAQYTNLHFLGCLVGKGHGKCRAKTRRVVDKQFDVFYGKCECLATTCAGFIYCECFMCGIHKLLVLGRYCCSVLAAIVSSRFMAACMSVAKEVWSVRKSDLPSAIVSYS